VAKNINRLIISFCVKVRLRLCAALLAFRVGPLCKALVRSIPCVGLGIWAAAMLFFAGRGAVVWGQSPDATEAYQSAEAINPQYEYNVKAAFLYSFGRYVEWPKDAFEERSGAFVIGVCGEDPFGQVLDRIAQSKTIQGRHIIIQKMATTEELQPCHILFISRSISIPEQITIINKTRDKATLLVGEVPKFAERGGGINFFLEGGTVRFEINVEAIRQEKLLLDAKLLNLGRKVSDTGIQPKKNSN
jgi:hypothetical protein